jgi:hypothetical protein
MALHSACQAKMRRQVAATSGKAAAPPNLDVDSSARGVVCSHILPLPETIRVTSGQAPGQARYLEGTLEPRALVILTHGLRITTL